jgi:hypothetical protein
MENSTTTRALEGMTIGHTSIVNGVPVTRWSAERFEVGTWGKETLALTFAVQKLVA